MLGSLITINHFQWSPNTLQSIVPSLHIAYYSICCHQSYYITYSISLLCCKSYVIFIDFSFRWRNTNSDDIVNCHCIISQCTVLHRHIHKDIMLHITSALCKYLYIRRWAFTSNSLPFTSKTLSYWHNDTHYKPEMAIPPSHLYVYKGIF